MPRRLWYPRRIHVQTISYTLAEALFSDYDSPLPPFILSGGEERGGALLDSALALPHQSFGGQYLYKTWYEKAGVLLRSLIKNHPLVDGNKRIGVATTLIFLHINGWYLIASNDELVSYALGIAASEPSPSWRTIGRWIKSHSIMINNIDEIFARLGQAVPQLSSDLMHTAKSIKALGRSARGLRDAIDELEREYRRSGLDPATIPQLL